MTDVSDMLPLVKPIGYLIEELRPDRRLILLASIMAQEICKLPPSARWNALATVMTSFPAILQSTEDCQRNALAANARHGT